MDASQFGLPNDTIPKRYHGSILWYFLSLSGLLMKSPPPESPLHADLPNSPPAHNCLSVILNPSERQTELSKIGTYNKISI